MNCWHCNNELEFNSQTDDSSKFYRCAECDSWYELRKDKEKLNGSVPVRIVEIENIGSL